ncbi:MAG: (2Fe-2S) ferredoxin domain-containing protein [Oscillospiraceae bacterium]
MLKVTVCIGSSCHLKGSRQIVERFNALIKQNNLAASVELSGKFCMNRCREGVCVTVDEEKFKVSPESADGFFTGEIMPRLN